ncbi:DNA internalization-related competence protein ComEC/Rec2 [bacterium]|nr:DNA internalization-related competence protein ComEC/Rec2 [bacterium]
MNKIIILTGVYIFGLISAILNAEYTFALVLIIILAFLRYKKIFSKFFSIGLFCLFIFANFNYDLHSKTTDNLSDLGFIDNSKITGKIISIPENLDERNKTRFYFRVDKIEYEKETKENLNSKTFVTINNTLHSPELKIGNIIEINGKLRKPSTASNPSQFDYRAYLAHKNTFTTFYGENDCYKIVQNKENAKEKMFWDLVQTLDKTRENILLKHKKYIKSPNYEILGGVVFGDDAVNPPEDIKEKFKNSGLMHLLAASGLNVALIFGIWWFVGSRISLSYRATIISGILLVAIYSVMTGLPPSILRASLMLLFVLIGKLFDKEADSFALVFFVGLILLVFNPQMIFDVGFQLSFVVTLGLIYCMDNVSKLLTNLNKKYKEAIKENKFRKYLKKITPAGLISMFCVPLVAQISVIPLQLYYFNTFTPYSFFANICILPFIGIVSFLGFVSSIFAFLHLDFCVQILDEIINPFISIIIGISKYFSSFDTSILFFPSPEIYQIILYYILIGFVFKSLGEKFESKKLITLSIILTITLCLSFIKPANNNLEILVFDVGNADSFLIKTPQNKHMLIDTGKLPYRGKSQAEMIINEYFKDKAIRKLDFLILTHFDIDHAGGAYDILKNFGIAQTIIEHGNTKNEASENFLKLAHEKKILVQKAKNNELIYSENELKIKTFYDKFSENANDNSVVVLLEYKNEKVLFMGDMSAKSYKKISHLIPEINILKIGHHGARESTDNFILEKLNPEKVIISTGSNHYGHPHPEALEIIRNHKIPILSTKEFGAIKFIYDEEKEKFTPYKFKNKKFEEII